MAEATGWAGIAASEANRGRGGAINNLKLVSGNNYNLRFVGDPIPFDKYFVNNKSAISDAGENCIIKRKFNIEPTKRFAVHVINRADNKLYIVELAPSVLKPVIAWWKARKHNPGGESGCDFNVDITGQKKMTRYTVTPLDITPFTEDELALINKEVPGGIDKCIDRLQKLYKATPQAEIEARLFGGGPAGQGGGNGNSAPTTQSVSAPQTAAAGSGKPAGWSEPPF